MTSSAAAGALPAIGVFDTGCPETASVIASYGPPLYFIAVEQYTRRIAGEPERTFTGSRGGVMGEKAAAVLKAMPDRRRFERQMSIAELQQLSQEIEEVMAIGKDEKQ